MKSEIIDPLKNRLQELRDALETLDNNQYTVPIPVLSNTSVGQHTRHTIEFLSELMKGYHSGYVNYDQRKRDRLIEENKVFALETLSSIMGQLEKEDRPLWLTILYGSNAALSHNLATNYARELVHNLEHVVHHMAIIRIGIMAISDNHLPDSFGTAVSTIRHKRQNSYSVKVKLKA